MLLITLTAVVAFYLAGYELLDNYNYIEQFIHNSQSIAFDEKEHDRMVQALAFNLVRDFLLVMIHSIFTWKCFSPNSPSSDYPLYNSYEDP